jgi:hypothetical protein
MYSDRPAAYVPRTVSERIVFGGTILLRHKSLAVSALTGVIVAAGTISASPASAAPPGPRIVDAYIVNDAGEPGVLEVGDSYDLVFDKAIFVNGPSFGMTVVDASGDRFYLGDQWPEIINSVGPLVVETKNGKTRILDDRVLSLQAFDLGSHAVINLPLTIVDIHGIYVPGDESRSVDLARSKDKVVDFE